MELAICQGDCSVCRAWEWLYRRGKDIDKPVLLCDNCSKKYDQTIRPN
ncbi:hypothetical protein LCGC14_0767740 [marine sediment metagenome]|uniref:Uncharacterized protein n=1 Tax=marine sediment metagenome TaxID=412755 RepID=A0A0F9Q3E0_9ZZZZ